MTTRPQSSEQEGNAAEIAAVEEASRQLLMEISKSLLSGTLATTRGAMQMLQGLSGFLLASYTTLLVGFAKQLPIERLQPILLGLPIVFYILSLLTGFGQVLLYRGANLTLGDLQSGVKAYEKVVSAQRKHLVLPLIFLFAGLAAVTIVIVEILRLQ
jgi:hypothetical protein